MFDALNCDESQLTQYALFSQVYYGKSATGGYRHPDDC